MRRFTVILLSILLAAATARSEGVSEGAKESLRLRLLEAFRSVPQLRFALVFDLEREDGKGQLEAECYLDGVRAGMRMRRAGSEGEDALLCVTDGITAQMFVNGVSSGSIEGARTLNDFIQPYEVARATISAELDEELRTREPYRPQLQLHLEEESDGPALKAALDVQPGEPPGWLDADYWDGKTVEVDEEKGWMSIRGALIAGRIGLADGIPLLWTGRNPTTGGRVEGRRVPPRLTSQE